MLIGYLVMFIFYGTYFLKIIIQNNKGIKADMLGKGNKGSKMYIFEVLLKLTTYTLAFIHVISIFTSSKDPNSYFDLSLGLFLSVLGTIVFIFAIVHMKDNWRAGIDSNSVTTIVTEGIYRYNRNPAFVGFYLLYIGIAVAFANTILVIVTVVTITMFHYQVLQEENYLKSVFFDEYSTYFANVSRYFII